VSAEIGAVRVRFEAAAEHREHAERVARELRGSLADEFDAALGNGFEEGVAIVPLLRVTLAAPLAQTTGREIARAIAAAAARAMDEGCVRLAREAAGGEREGSAEEALRMLTLHDGIRIDRATEAAAWLLALARDERTVLRRASPYADLERLPAGAALVAVCERAGARAVFGALGAAAGAELTARASAAEARRLLILFDDGSEPDAATWLALRAWFAAARFADHAPDELRALAAVLSGFFQGLSGVVPAARRLAAAVREPAATASDPADRSGSEAQTSTCECAGFWLLLPHLARRMPDLSDAAARGLAVRLALRLWGAQAADDPAIAAFAADEPLPEPPPGVRLERLAVGLLRDFAQTLFRFERARPGYVLRAFLRGTARLRPVEGGWSATLPESPLRVMLERAALRGSVAAPWTEPALTFERDP
jgi:hypothetical protein